MGGPLNNAKFRNYLEELVEKHIPTYFVDCEYLEKIMGAISFEHDMSRREVLMLAYTIGANEDETNELLKTKGYDCLYVKRREDAIWKFALKTRIDLTNIIDKIFPQDVDDIGN